VELVATVVTGAMAELGLGVAEVVDRPVIGLLVMRLGDGFVVEPGTT
jgi:hypothetical protein